MQLFGQGHALHRHAIELQANLAEGRRQFGAERGGKGNLVGSEVKEWNLAAGNRVADVLQHQPAQLAVEVGHGVALTRARDFGVEELGVGHAEAVVAKGAQPHRAEVFVADGDGLGRAPLLVHLLAGAEEVNIAFERGLKQLVPILQIGEYRQRLGGQLVHAGAKHVGHFALVDEHRHLRFAHRQRRAVLDLHLRHREAPGQRAVVVLGPLDDVDELFLDEIHQCHGVLPVLVCGRPEKMIPAPGRSVPWQVVATFLVAIPQVHTRARADLA